MKPYRQLTRRGRLRRSRDVARVALAAYGFTEARLTFLQYSSNITYRVDVDSNERQPAFLSGMDPGIFKRDRYLLRIHAMDHIDGIISELLWLQALNEAGIIAPLPVPAPDSSLLGEITVPGILDGRVVTLLRWLNGHHMEKRMRPQHLHLLGNAVAGLHNFAAGWQPPPGFSRPSWDWDSQLGGSMFDQPVEELVASMPLEFQSSFQTISNDAHRVMTAFGKGSDAFGLVHADLYPDNLLFKDGRVVIIDYEDLGYSWWLWDIALALSPWAWGAEWERMRDAFYHGYAQTRNLPAAQWAQLDLFVASVFATMLLWASAFLLDDPARSAEHIPWRDDNGKKLLGYFRR